MRHNPRKKLQNRLPVRVHGKRRKQVRSQEEPARTRTEVPDVQPQPHNDDQQSSTTSSSSSSSNQSQSDQSSSSSSSSSTTHRAREVEYNEPPSSHRVRESESQPTRDRTPHSSPPPAPVQHNEPTNDYSQTAPSIPPRLPHNPASAKAIVHLTTAAPHPHDPLKMVRSELMRTIDHFTVNVMRRMILRLHYFFMKNIKRVPLFAARITMPHSGNQYCLSCQQSAPVTSCKFSHINIV